ncbi:MAG: pyruvate, phosphate dikinase, partial [Candidatus Cloacimonadota bacterium]|nr:pyruvate, phosphate dikinase [Candidatus Cloacimonadota bacterium]
NVIGNGEFGEIRDVVFILPEKYNNLKTYEMSQELALLNAKFSDDEKYVLIGGGRWGSRDRFLGIPVKWSDINNAQVIIEYALKNKPVDPSFGSHFLHNLIAANVGYLSILNNSKIDFIDWEWLKKQEIISQGDYFCHIKTKIGMQLTIDSKNSLAILTKNKESKKTKKRR